MKIYNTNEFESVSNNEVPNNIAVVNLQQGNKFVHIEFNKNQTHLIALVINHKSEKNFKYFLNVYAMESIKVDGSNSQQVLQFFVFKFFVLIKRGFFSFFVFR